MPTRYALVGTGGRCRMFIDAILGPYKDRARLVGLCDVSQTRMNYHNREIGTRFNVPPLPTYLAADFDRMIAETRPDVVIVTSVDATHHTYIIRAMELGCDAVSEKPMTTDAEKARAILDAVDRTGRRLRVAFNYRYQPAVSEMKRMILEGAIGRPTLVDFAWTLDTRHGADYFRRWHREKSNSGGLLVHKASHHFDLVNWWLASYPKQVFCLGDLAFYGRDAAAARGETYSYDRYTGEPAAKADKFALTLDSDPRLKALYLDAEQDSGYVRDRNVFGGPIDIEDTMAVTARYRSGAILNYSLVAYSPWEGVRVAITGTRGRIELEQRHGSHIIAGQSDAELAAQQSKGERNESLTYYPMFAAKREIEVKKAAGGHGGGDALVLDRIFNPDAAPDPLGRDASHIDGTASILLGACANESIRTGKAIDCDDLVPLP
jgi:predicted dehydrogenase